MDILGLPKPALLFGHLHIFVVSEGECSERNTLESSNQYLLNLVGM